MYIYIDICISYGVVGQQCRHANVFQAAPQHNPRNIKCITQSQYINFEYTQ